MFHTVIKMNLFCRVIIRAVLFLLLPVACLAFQAPAPGTMKSIRVVMDDNYPPYVFKDEQGNLKGILIDQWRLWEKKSGIRAELHGMNWGEAQRRMQAGEYDVIDTIFKTVKREAIYDFTKPYGKIDFTIFLHDDISGIRNASDLKGFVVGVKAGGAVIDILKQHGIENVMAFPSDLTMVEAARDAKIRVFVIGHYSALYFLNKLQIAKDFRHTETLFSSEFHRAVRKGQGELLATVEKGFAEISAAEYKAIDKQWMGTPVSALPQLKYLRDVAGVVGAVFAAILIWVVLLKKAVRLKTAQLTESEERYRSIIENLQDVYYRSDSEGRLTMISPSGVKLLGYDHVGQMLGQPIRDNLYHDPDERDAFLHNLRMKGYLYGYEVTLKRRDGTPVQVETSTHQMFDPNGVFIGVEGVFRDVTQRNRDQQALDYANECFQQALKSTTHILYRLNVKQGGYDYLSPVAEKITGYPLEQYGKSRFEDVLELIHSDDRATIMALMEKKRAAMTGSSFDLDIEYRFRKADGSYCWLHDSNTACFDGRGELECFFGAVQDITERKHTENLLRESEERYRMLVEQSSAWIWKTDETLRHTYSNDNVETLLGYTPDELSSIDILKIVHPDDHDTLGKIVENAISGGVGWNGAVLRWLSRDGTWRSIESSGMPVFDEQGRFTGLQGVDTDITDRLQLQHEREKGQRLESLGLLAGGIAHDFNNILTGIVGNLSLARMLIENDHRAAGRLEESVKAAKRASELTQQLLTFARGGEPVKKAVDMKRLLGEAVSFGLRGSNVKGNVEISGDLWPIDADEGQINQVLNNLLINATQAMPGGGTVTVSAANSASGEPAERFVRISVRDTGSGMPPEIVQKIFDPYFTTRAGGTGLGLASVYSIVTRHGGSVTVTSEPGIGSEFVICLPAAENAFSPEQPRSTFRTGALAGRRVLVMDDEEMIVEVVSMMLEELGSEADACRNGTEAVELYRASMERGTPYDVVLLDLTVPGGMGGLEAARLIRDMDPDATLVVSSGYSHDSVAADHGEHGFSGSVMKPYTIDSLSEELERVVMLRRELKRAT